MSASFSYRAFKNYTRFVVASKVALSALVILLLVFAVAVPLITNHNSSMRVVFAEAPVGEAVEKKLPTMLKPRFQSVDDKQQPYLVTADIAIQQEDESIALETIEADLTTNDNEALILRAVRGNINVEQDALILRDNVQLFHSAGHEMSTDSLDVNLASFDAIGDKPVQIQGPMGHIKADRFTITKQGDRLLFTGNVYMLLYPQ